MIVLRHTHQLAHTVFSAHVNFIEGLRAMADSHHAHADARQTQHFALCFFQNGQGKHGWACAEIKDSLGHLFSPAPGTLVLSSVGRSALPTIRATTDRGTNRSDSVRK